MFNFGGVTHILPNPNGTFSLVGSVPVAMMTQRKPTVADVMGGRIKPDGFAYVGKAYQSIEQIKQAAFESGANLCSSPSCACRKTF